MALANAPVSLYGHSAGCALALRAAAAGLALTHLVLADPPYTPHGSSDETARAEHAEQAERIQRLNDVGDFKGSAKFFLSGFGLSEAELEAMLQSPAGAAMVEAAKTLPYDYLMLGDGLVPTTLATKVRPPTLVLAPRTMPEAALQLVHALPNARFAALDAATHELSPEAIVPLLASFLKG
jgi:thioesterase domain-containing protein